MGIGIDLAKEDSPEHAAVIEDFRDQLLVALVKHYGPVVTVPVADVDATGGYVMLMRVDAETREFHLEVRKKQ